MKNNNVVLVYISTVEKELHPAIYTLKSYALKYLGEKAPEITTRTIRAEKYAKSASYSVYPTFSTREVRSIVKDLLKHNPKMIGFSTYVWNIEATLKIARMIRKTASCIPLILGGAEATYNAESILRKEKCVDIIALDEAEQTTVELIDSIVFHKRPLSSIPGIRYKKGGKTISNGVRKPLDLSAVPSPYLSGTINLRHEKASTFVVETSRGCPFHCAYCSYNINGYSNFRFFPLERVENELIFLLNNRVKNINVIDDNFNIYDARARRIIQIISEHNRGTKIELFIRADAWLIGEKLVSLLADRNLHLTIGVQSLNKTTLSQAKRIHQKAVLERNLSLLDEKRVRYTLQFIIGMPGDTYEDIKENVDWSLSFNPQFVHMQTLRINPGTLYQQRAQEFGITYHKTPPYNINKTYSMSAESLKQSELFNTMFKLFYEGGFLRTLITELHSSLNIKYSLLIEELTGFIKPVDLFISDTRQLKNTVKKYLRHILRKNNGEHMHKALEQLVNKGLTVIKK